MSLALASHGYLSDGIAGGAVPPPPTPLGGSGVVDAGPPTPGGTAEVVTEVIQVP